MCITVYTYVLTWKEHDSVLVSIVLCVESTLCFLGARNLVGARVQPPGLGELDCHVFFWSWALLVGFGIREKEWNWTCQPPDSPSSCQIMLQMVSKSLVFPCVFIDFFGTHPNPGEFRHRQVLGPASGVEEVLYIIIIIIIIMIIIIILIIIITIIIIVTIIIVTIIIMIKGSLVEKLPTYGDLKMQRVQ